MRMVSDFDFSSFLHLERTSSLLSHHRGMPATLIWAILVSAAVATIFVLSYGSVLATGVFISTLAIALISFYRLDWGFYLLVGLVLMLDQFGIPGFEPYTFQIGYFRNLKEVSYLPLSELAVTNALELHLLLLLCVWVIILTVRKNVALKPVPVWGAALIFFAWVVFSFIYGLRRNGDFLPALWEIRALFYLGIMYFFVPQIIRTKEQLQTLMWVCIAAISVKAFQGVGRFIYLGFSFYGFPTLTSHEDPVFFTTLIIFLLGLVLFKAHHKQRIALILLLLPLTIGFIVAQRRAAYAGLGISLPVLFVLIPVQQRWILLKSFLPFALVIAIYCAVFWDDTGKWGGPVRLIKSGFTTEKEEAGDRYYSNLYREFENYDLAVTGRHSPVIGLGFGTRYLRPIPLARIPFDLSPYIPHDQILWLLVKTGAIGFFLFFLFLDSYVVRCSSLFSRLIDPYGKAICLMVIIAIINQLVVSYYDMQLTFYRNMIYLGTLMGLLPALQTFDKLPPSSSSSRSDR